MELKEQIEKESQKKKRSEKKKKKRSLNRSKNKSDSIGDITNKRLLSFQEVPDNIKDLVDKDDLMLNTIPDGNCGINSGAAHILEDQTEGKKLRRVINQHIMDRWPYYENKIPFPYNRKVGAAGEHEDFEDKDEFFKFLVSNKKATLLWTDSEDLHALANM